MNQKTHRKNKEGGSEVVLLQHLLQILALIFTTITADLILRLFCVCLALVVSQILKEEFKRICFHLITEKNAMNISEDTLKYIYHQHVCAGLSAYVSACMSVFLWRETAKILLK